MLPRKRIFCLGVMIETPASPTIRVVTEGAIGAKAAFVMFVLVAARACDRRILERRRSVALLARYDCVTADQRKSCYVVIECRGSAPACILMALLTTTAELPLMGIILLVAGHARRRELLIEKRADVAGVAFDFYVRASERILRLVMIEAYSLPLALIVTRLAFRAVSAGVDVLYLMTPDAGCGDAAIALAGVTG